VRAIEIASMENLFAELPSRADKEGLFSFRVEPE